MAPWRLLWSARPGRPFDAAKEFSPWDSDLEDFGPLFLNVALCLLPGVVVIISRLYFACTERVCLPARDLSIASLELKQELGTTHVLLPGVSPLGGLGDGLMEGVTRVYKNSWPSWRQFCNGAFAASSFTAFLALMLAAQLKLDQAAPMPVSEALGCACLAISSIFAVSFYRKELIQSRSPRTKRCSRRIGLQVFWALMWLVVAVRLQNACRHWNDPDTLTIFWRVVWIIIATLQFALATLGLILAFHSDQPREEALELLRNAFEDVTEAETDAGLASLSCVADPHRISPERSAGFLRMLTFTWMESMIKVGRKRTMTISDFPNLVPNRRRSSNSPNHPSPSPAD